MVVHELRELTQINRLGMNRMIGMTGMKEWNTDDTNRQEWLGGVWIHKDNGKEQVGSKACIPLLAWDWGLWIHKFTPSYI